MLFRFNIEKIVSLEVMIDSDNIDRAIEKLSQLNANKALDGHYDYINTRVEATEILDDGDFGITYTL